MSEEDKNKILVSLKKEGDLYTTQLFGQDYAFRKWTWGEKNRTFSKCQRIGPSGEIQFDQAEFNMTLLLSTLKKAPFPINRETFDNYPDSPFIDLLVQITSKLNILNQFEIQNL
jgi:hypothetical protein